MRMKCCRPKAEPQPHHEESPHAIVKAPIPPLSTMSGVEENTFTA